MYAKKRAEKAEKEKEKKAQQKQFEETEKEENKRNEELIKQVEAKFTEKRPKPKHLKCQFCNEKPRSINEAGSFRFHFFSHYKDNLNEW